MYVGVRGCVFVVNFLRFNEFLLCGRCCVKRWGFSGDGYGRVLFGFGF